MSKSKDLIRMCEQRSCTMDDIKVGDIIQVRTWSGDIVVGKVTRTDSDIKNGSPGIEYVIVGTGEGYWAYLSQIEKKSGYLLLTEGRNRMIQFPMTCKKCGYTDDEREFLPPDLMLQLSMGDITGRMPDVFVCPKCGSTDLKSEFD